MSPFLSEVLLTLVLAAPQPVNSIAGDASFVERFDRAPIARDDRDPSLRVRVHLEWVARELRDHPAPSPALQKQRDRMLDALEAYTAAGRFPINRRFAVRRPRFVDEEGRWCAVGHLIVIDGATSLAHSIADRFEYDQPVCPTARRKRIAGSLTQKRARSLA